MFVQAGGDLSAKEAKFKVIESISCALILIIHVIYSFISFPFVIFWFFGEVRLVVEIFIFPCNCKFASEGLPVFK